MRTMEFSFHKVANYAAFFVFLCSVLLISGASTVQAENNAWVLDRVEYGTDQYTEWVVEAWGFKTEYSVSLGESQLKSTTKHTQTTMDGTVILWQDVEFIFDYVTPPEELIPGKNVSLLVEGTSSGDPWHESSSESFMSYVDTWSYSGQRLEQIFSMQMDLDQENQSADEINAFKVPDLIDGQLKIKVRLGIGAQFYVNFIYEPGTVTLEEEGFVLENTGTGEVKVNDVPLPPCSQSLQGFDRDVAVASEGCITPLDLFDEILLGENSWPLLKKTAFKELLILYC